MENLFTIDSLRQNAMLYGKTKTRKAKKRMNKHQKSAITK